MLKANKNKGFTIIEALVAIAVLMMALGGPLVLAVSSIGDARASKNKVTAFYLAEEALEYVRNVRDSNFLQRTTETSSPKPTDWLAGLSNCFSGNCYFDVFISPPSIASCVGTCPLMKINNTNNHYGYTGADSIFTRYITIVNSGNEIKVTVTVVWTEHGTTKWVVLTQNMFNLAPDP